MLMRTRTANEATKQALEKHSQKTAEIEKTVQRKVRQIEEVKKEAAVLSPDAIADGVRNELRLYIERGGDANIRDNF